MGWSEKRFGLEWLSGLLVDVIGVLDERDDVQVAELEVRSEESSVGVAAEAFDERE